jgi:hypothetical protein
MTPNAARTLACARHLHSLGLTPLPTRHDAKIPDLPKYTHFYEGEPVDDAVYDGWRSCNMQVITGTNHPGTRSIAVIDLDGDEAKNAWNRICAHHKYAPRSPWMVETGSGGIHVWYSLPATVSECQSGIIWGIYDTFGEDGKGTWLKHKEIRILGDRALAMAPPSFHPETGKRYRFFPGASPNEIAWPEPLPDWLRGMDRLTSPSFTGSSIGPIAIRPREKLSGRHYMRGEVLSAITDKVGLMKEWGLRFDREQPNQSGWASCFVPWREDPKKSRASGTMHCVDGTFQDRKDGRAMGFFDLACILQPAMFRKWQECRDYCGDRFIGRIRR